MTFHLQIFNMHFYIVSISVIKLQDIYKQSMEVICHLYFQNKVFRCR